MPHSIAPFPITQGNKPSVVNQKIASISPEMRSVHIGISPNIQKFVQYPSFLTVFSYGDVVASSTEKMEAVYERVTAFLQKTQDDDYRLK